MHTIVQRRPFVINQPQAMISADTKPFVKRGHGFEENSFSKEAWPPNTRRLKNVRSLRHPATQAMAGCEILFNNTTTQLAQSVIRASTGAGITLLSGIISRLVLHISHLLAARYLSRSHQKPSSAQHAELESFLSLETALIRSCLKPGLMVACGMGTLTWSINSVLPDFLSSITGLPEPFTGSAVILVSHMIATMLLLGYHAAKAP